MCLQLRSRRAEAAGGRAHDRRRLSRPRIVAVGSRCPVNRVLEHSRDRITASDSRMRRLRTGAEAAGDAKDVDGLPHLVSLLAVAVLAIDSTGRISPSIVGMSSETVGWMGMACSSTS